MFCLGIGPDDKKWVRRYPHMSYPMRYLSVRLLSRNWASSLIRDGCLGVWSASVPNLKCWSVSVFDGPWVHDVRYLLYVFLPIYGCSVFFWGGGNVAFTEITISTSNRCFSKCPYEHKNMHWVYPSHSQSNLTSSNHFYISVFMLVRRCICCFMRVFPLVMTMQPVIAGLLIWIGTNLPSTSTCLKNPGPVVLLLPTLSDIHGTTVTQFRPVISRSVFNIDVPWCTHVFSTDFHIRTPRYRFSCLDSRSYRCSFLPNASPV